MNKRTYNGCKQTRDALSDRELRDWADRLKDDWATLTRIQRGDIATMLIFNGCSARGIAAFIGQSASTVLRLVRISRLFEFLTEDQQNAVDELGVDPEFFLREQMGSISKAGKGTKVPELPFAATEPIAAIAVERPARN
jgi:hypothetical protein